MSSSASRERASSLAALSSDVAAGAPATASPKNGRRSVMGVPRVTKIPSFRRSSSGKMSKRRDVPAGELAGLDAALEVQSYVAGFAPSAEDAKLYAKHAGSAVDTAKYPNFARWLAHMASFDAATRAAW